MQKVRNACPWPTVLETDNMTKDSILDSNDSEAICLAVNNLDDTIVECVILDSVGRVVGANVKVTRFTDNKHTDFNDTHGAMLALVMES